MVKFCPSCGEELVDNAKFCKSCGAKLSDETPRPQGPVRPVSEKSYTIHIVVSYIFALFMPLIGIILAVYLLTRDSSDAKKHGKYVLIVSFVIVFLSLLRFL